MQIPGVIINSHSRIVIKRTLSVPGEVLVQPGQVKALDVIARAEVPSRYQVIDLARQLAQAQVDMNQVMLKVEGDPVNANEPIARASGGLPFLQQVIRAPAAGYIAAIGPGWVLLEIERSLVEVQAFINGVVTRIIPQQGVVIEAMGTVVEAACGFGGEAYGPLKRMVDTPVEALEAEAIDASAKNCILLGGSSVDEAALYKAEEMQVRGIIAGSIDATLLNLEPPVKVRVVATEGFGHLPMSSYTFGLLDTLAGQDLSIRGSTPSLSPPIAHREMQPVILATTGPISSSTDAQLPGQEPTGPHLKVGCQVRITRGEFLGASGTVDALPAEPQATGIGLVTPGAYIKLADTRPYVPLANLEQIDDITTTFSG